MPVVVSTSSPPKPVKLVVSVEGRALSESEANKLARCIQSSVRWELGLNGDYKDGEDPLEVVLTAEPLSAETETASPENADVEKIDAGAIAAMTTPEYRAAKAAGQV